MNVIDARTHPPESRGFARDRLDILLSQISRHRLTLVTAPPGSGKTTALSQFAAQSKQPVAWYTADSLDGRPATFMAYLRHAIHHACELGDDKCECTADLVHSIDEASSNGLTLVLDDFHLLSGQPAEDVVAEMLATLPPDVHIVISSRLPPNVDTSALQLTDNVFKIDGDDLRFRSWEAELLLTEWYDLLLRPDDVARLTRQVGGWAAGLQLFHLAARGKLPAEQKRLIRTASTRSALARQYFTNHVVNAMPAELRSFLVPTSVLGVVRADLADDLLDRTGSAAELDQLERFGWFVSRIDHMTYRYHDVMRTHLESILADQIPAADLMERYVRAAQLLEGAGFLGDAIRCRVRAGQTREVGRLVGRACREPTKATAGWLDVVDDIDVAERGGDPWISLARARDEVGSGHFRRACAFYRRAETLFGDADEALDCHQERTALDSFRDPLNPAPAGWLGHLRCGLQSDPLGAARDLTKHGTASALVASAALRFVAADFDGAAEQFDAALLSDDVPDWAVDIARLGHQLVRLVNGPADRQATMTVVDRLTGGLDRLWCRRLADAVVAMTTGASGTEHAARISDRCLDNDDPWGAAFSALCAGVAANRGTESVKHFQRALRLANEHRSWLLASWAHGGLARSVPSDERDEHSTEAGRLARKMGLERSPIEAFFELGCLPSSTTSEPKRPLAPGVVVRCFGGLFIETAESAIDQLRPRSREVLMRLAMQIGRTVHRDRLIAELWPDSDEEPAVRSLQVAISSIRRALDDADAPVSVRRADNAYILTEPANGTCDLLEFHRLAGIADQSDIDADDRLDAAHQALELHDGELLTGAGTSDWVLVERERLRLAAATLARRSALVALDQGRYGRAVDFSRIGLEHDRFDDGLWRAAIDAHQALGDDGTAEQLRRSYQAVLDDLGVEAASRRH